MHRATWNWFIHNRKRVIFKVITVGAFVGSSAFIYSSNGQSIADRSPSSTLIFATSAVKPLLNTHDSIRTYTTSADIFYRKNKQLPVPIKIHVSLEDLIRNDERTTGFGTWCQKNHVTHIEKILVIGDIHGCLNELILLVEKAIQDENDGRPFDAIILVGDLVNKGPSSAEVIKFVRKQRGWYTVRGNHDNSALLAALGDENRMGQTKYQWLQNNTLSDEDILWMSGLPYTITIPSVVWKHGYNLDTIDTIIVHAGLVPKTELVDQDLMSMITIRDVISSSDGSSYQHFIRQAVSVEGEKSYHPVPWAKVWNENKGPALIIFGHDAKRKLQYTEYAIGLDTGAVYGGYLTGCILPTKKIVSVESKQQYFSVERQKVN